ncbi:MAG: hypothetical protein Kow0031_09570 [Anaerolineae bacterium]
MQHNSSVNQKQYFSSGGLLAVLLLALAVWLAWPQTLPTHAQEPTTAEKSGQIAAFPGANGKIAFSSNRDGNNEIYVMNADGSGQTRLTNNPAPDVFPAWSPDGTKIAFNRSKRHIYYMNADGSGETFVTSSLLIFIDGPKWSPDGTKLIFSGVADVAKVRSPDIFTINLDGTNLTNLTNSTSADSNAAWSPDGSKIAFSSTRDGAPEIYVMNADGTGVTQLTNDPFENFEPAWSPDGTKILYRANELSFIWFIRVMNADGSNQFDQFYANSKNSYPAWSPDGSKIVFDSNRANGNQDIYMAPFATAPGTPEGPAQTRLTTNAASDASPDWQPLQSGTIVIVQAAQPADDTVFTYTDTISAPNGFTLQNPGLITKTFSQAAAGVYTVTQAALNGWSLHDITCDDTDSSGNATSRAATINLATGETVTCTFNNIESNTIIVNKFTVGGDGTFPFTSTIPSHTAFNMTTTDGFTATLFGGLTPNQTYAISETVPAGWSIYEADPICSNGDPASAISLAAGEVAVCNFINLADDTLVVEKRTIGGDGTFDFTTSNLGGPFSLTTKKQTAKQTFTGLTPGQTYGITETVPSGWTQTGASCDNGDSPGSISLGAGEHVTCVFTNTKQASLTVVKLTDGQDGTFDFTSTVPGQSAFSLTTSNTFVVTNFLNIPPGTYSITETAQIGWAPDWISCSDGKNPAALALAPGDAITCSFASSRAVYYLPIITKNSTP